MGFYRVADAHNPRVYLAGVVAALSDYPVEIICQVVDPRNGIPSKIKWLPTIAEIKEACESRYAPHRYAADWDKRAAEKIAARDTLAIPDYRPKTTPNKQYTYAEFMEMTGGKGRPIGRFEQKAEFEKTETAPEPQPLDTLPEATDALVSALHARQL
jgi:hypothetical protein